MKADSFTPYDIFQQAQVLLVPQFQRPYVWTEEAQWRPLWEDIEQVAERLLANPRGNHRPHFLGAVVFQQQHSDPGQMLQRTIIDGQQRLTTLQILIDAVQAEMEALGAELPAEFLRELNENDKKYRKHDDDRFKLWPTKRDKPAFREVMGTPPPVDHSKLKFKNDQIPKAHQFFARMAREFLTAEGEAEVLGRAEALRTSIRDLLRLVVISLDPDEDAQEIFETLNSRGTPLSSADLIKNFLFQRLVVEGVDVEDADAKYWQRFETGFWEKPVSVGRRPYPRAAIFLTHFLISRIGEPVKAAEVFQRFKQFVTEECELSTVELLRQIHDLAFEYEQRIVRIASSDGELDRVDLFLYRTQIMDIEIVTPLFLALIDPAAEPLDKNDLSMVLADVESWLIRRALIRSTTKNYNKIFAELIQDLRKNGRSGFALRARDFFAGQSSDSGYWPDDRQLTAYLTTAPVYSSLRRERLRMVLEALEDDLRGLTSAKDSKSEQRCPRYKLTIEHILPQSWRDSWGLGDSPSIEERDARVHVLGNLTLLNQKLNSSVSNGEWLGSGGKREALNAHGVLLLNSRLSEFERPDWGNSSIDDRSRELIGRLLSVWPVPQGHVVQIVTESPAPEAKSVQISDLMNAGLLSEGAVLEAVPMLLEGRTCIVLPDGTLETDDQVRHGSPSAAGRHVAKASAAAGWHFWRVQGSTKRLFDLREEYRAMFDVEISKDADESDESE